MLGYKEISITMYKSLTLVSIFLLSGCANFGPKSIEEKAVYICGLGISDLAKDSLVASLEKASTNPNGVFSYEAKEYTETQVTLFFKQAQINNNEALKIAAEEIKATRDCAIEYVDLRRPILTSNSELQEMCRLDVERKLTPKGNKGTLAQWNLPNGEFMKDKEVVIMRGVFSNGGCRSQLIEAKCRFEGKNFSESVITQSKKGGC